jgi:hypothetical protein
MYVGYIRVNDCQRLLVDANRETKTNNPTQMERNLTAKPTHACVEIIITIKKKHKFYFASSILQGVCVFFCQH